MGKHVCPVCEDVYAVQASVDVQQGERSSVAEGWGCPACGYMFIGLTDAEGLIRWAVEPYEASSTSVAGHLVGSSVVTRRVEALASSSPGFPS
jgi:hypothetical protein